MTPTDFSDHESRQNLTNGERFVRIETVMDLEFQRMDRDIILARQIVEAARKEAKEQVEHKLDLLNEHQRRMDRLEETFAIKKDLARTDKMVFVGLGIILTVMFLLKFFVK